MNPARLALRSICLAAALALLAPVAGAAYKITKVTRAGAANLEFWDINNTGLVTGSAANADYSVRTGFIYNTHTRVFTDLTGPAGAIASSASGISDTGVVVGGYTTAAQESRAFIYEGGSYTDFSLLGATSIGLRGVSADARYLSGYYFAGAGSHGFIFDRSTSALTDLGLNAVVNGINGHGVVAGSIFGAGRTPFLYDVGTNVRTDYTPVVDRYRDINDGGTIAGYTLLDGSDGFVGIVGAPGSASVLNVAGSQSTFGYGINNDVTVVGSYFRRDDTSGAFIATSVPESGTWALMLGGLLGLGTLRRGVTR